MEIIESELTVAIPEENKAVVKRVIHCTADFDYAVNLAFSDGVCAKAIEALKNGCDIVTDTQMAKSGINKTAAAKLGCEIHCFIDAGTVRPELVIGVPVGFVNILEAKDAIMEAGVPYIVAKGRKGGSNVAAAIVNALMYQIAR